METKKNRWEEIAGVKFLKAGDKKTLNCKSPFCA